MTQFAGFGWGRLRRTSALCPLAWLALGCGPSEADLVPMNRAEPTLGGRPVLRLTSAPSQALGQLSAESSVALEAIAKLTTPDASGLTTLRRSLDSDVSRVREAAIDMLIAWLGAPEGTGPLRTETALVLLAAARDARPENAEAATSALRELDTTTRDTLFDRGLRSTDLNVALGAARLWPSLLSPGGGAEARAARLLAVLDEAPPSVAFTLIASHCGELPKALRDGLVTPEGDSGPDGGSGPNGDSGPDGATAVAKRAAGVVCALASGASGVSAAPLAVALAAEPIDPELVAAVADAVFELIAAEGAVVPSAGLTQSKPALLAGLTRAATAQSWPVAISVGLARAALGEADGTTTLAIFVRGGDPDARYAALRGLVRLGEHERLAAADLLPALERASENSESAVRALVAEAASLVEDGRVIGLLGRLIRDGNVEVRFQAAYGAGRTNSLKLLAVLCEHGITDTSDRVRDASYAALHRIVHGFELPPPSMVATWLSEPGPTGDRPFWGRDHIKWREYYQNR